MSSTKKSTPWLWGKVEDALEHLKVGIEQGTRNKELFDTKLETEFYTDASKDDLGAILLQKPVSYMSQQISKNAK